MSDRTFSHEHDWQPLERWGARYRCSICKAFGHKPSHYNREGHIKAYQCHKKGCKGFAVAKEDHGYPIGKYKRWVCTHHRKDKE